MTELRAITLWQPWATLIAVGAKTIETRGRAHPWRGAIGERVAIHAAGRPMRLPRWPKGDQRREPNPAEFALHELGACECGHDTLTCLRHGLATVPFSAVVALANVVDVLPIRPSAPTAGADEHARFVADVQPQPRLMIVRGVQRGDDPEDFTVERLIEDQRRFGDYSPNRWALVLDDVARLPEPVPVRGHQGLWRVPDDVAGAVALREVLA